MAHLRPNRAPSGEPLVWLTGMGLALGLAMVAALLWTVASHGVSVFWPQRIEQLRVATGASEEELAGIVARSGERRPPGGPPVAEVQLYLANRNLLPGTFRFVDVDAIRARSTPADLMLIERWTDGAAIGRPVSLQLADGSVVRAEEPSFEPRLGALVDEIGDRRARIAESKAHIGQLAAQIDALRRRARRYADGTADARAIAERIAELEAASTRHAATAADLERQQGAHRLRLGVVGAGDKDLPLDRIARYTFPNRMGALERTGTFLGNCWRFLTEAPREANTDGGIFPAIFGTLAMTLLMSVLVTPFGVLAAIYLREYARQGALVRAVRIAVNNLAGVPSIVFGVFGLGFFVYGVGGSIDRMFFADTLPTPTFGTGGIMWAAFTLALMTVPVVIVATEEAISAVPRGAREGSLACGASKWQTIRHVVLPASVPGILTGLILAMARGAGEVAPLMMVGVVKLAPSLPIDLQAPFVHLDQKFMHLGFHIYDLAFQSPDSDAARPMVYATTLLLIVLVVVLNLGAIVLRERVRRRLASAAF